MDNNFFKKTSLKGLLILERPTFEDGRGFFREVFHIDELEKLIGGKFNLAQWNHSCSKKGVIRGLHAENWNKIVYRVTGKMFTAVVDIRIESQTFGKVETFILDDTNRIALFIPKGFANSVCTMGDEDVNYLYLVDAYYDGTDTKAVAFDDPDLSIDWPVKNPIVSQRDKNNPRLRELFPEKFK